MRLPEHLRTRINELIAAARERLPRVSRADLVNGSLRAGLPNDHSARHSSSSSTPVAWNVPASPDAARLR